ncbi:thioesterase family protein [Desertibaculum subflavum]|uniref:thioesterase family protein n=1 Tax=Desertibaculum subflavum TaxID=2268458 RepID=UPI000E66F4AF
MTVQIPAPFETYRAEVQEAWIDYNKHMNMGYYMVVFDEATGGFFQAVGLDRPHRQKHKVTTFSLEAHINYVREVGLGDTLRFTTRLLDFDSKRLHYFHEMWHATEGYLASTNELVSLHVSQETRRAAPMTPEIMDRLAAIRAAHAKLPPSPYIGRSIGLASKPPRA